MKINKIEKIVKLSERKLYRYLRKELEKLGYSPKEGKKSSYLYAKGTIPVLLIAHTDTVHYGLPKEVFYDPARGVMWSPEGLGADDRAGVFAVLELVQHYKCGVLFCSGEESGGTGVRQFLAEHPFNQGYLMGIELDRCGTLDCVFYDNNSNQFHDYIQDFGFVKAWGSFSDISILGPAWRLNTVNLSVGYEDEHTKQERLYIRDLLSTIDRIENMLSRAIPKFEYEEYKYYNRFGKGSTYTYDYYDGYSQYELWQKYDDVERCSLCGKTYVVEYMKEVEDVYACSACFKSGCFTCDICGENYFLYGQPTEGVCVDCWYDYIERSASPLPKHRGEEDEDAEEGKRLPVRKEDI